MHSDLMSYYAFISTKLKWKSLQIVANSRSSEAFVAMCLLTVTGTSLATQKLGFSDTVCAFNSFLTVMSCTFRVDHENIGISPADPSTYFNIGKFVHRLIKYGYSL